MDESAPLTRTGVARFDYQIECCEQHPGLVFNVGCHVDPAELQARFGERIVNCDREEYDSSPGYDPGCPNPVDRVFNVLEPWPCADDEGELVILGDILEHFPGEKIPQILHEAHRVAPVLCVTVPEDTRINQDTQRERWKPDFYNRHTTVMTRTLTESLVTGAGYQVERLWTSIQEYDEVLGHALTARRV